MKKLIYLTMFFFIFAPSSFAIEKIPGLIGFGTTTRGEYGNSQNANICIVDDITNNNNTLADDADYQSTGNAVKLGSLRECINWDQDNKIILFQISGTIDGGAGDPPKYEVDNDYVGIYGQTAPSPGITLKNIRFHVLGSDVVVQHIRIRVGDIGSKTSTTNSVEIDPKNGTLSNIIFDHTSTSWAPDTVFSAGASQSGGSVSNVTFSNSIVAEGLADSIHTEGSHSKGSMFDGISAPASNIAILKNLFFESANRNPYLQDATNVVMANNMAHLGWESIHSTFWSPQVAAVTVNLTNNISLGEGSSTDDSILTTGGSPYNDGTGSSLYLIGNKAGDYVTGTPSWQETQDDSSDWSVVDIRCAPDCETGGVPKFKEETENVSIPGATYWATDDVYANIQANVGARPDDRDTVDTRIIAEIAAGTYSNLIDVISYAVTDCTAADEPTGCCTGSGTWDCVRNDETGWPSLASITSAHADLPASPHTVSVLGYTNLEAWVQDHARFVEGSKLEAQSVSPPDNGTGVSTTASATWFHSTLVDSVELWLDTGACDGTPDDAGSDDVGDESSGDADGTYDMSTLTPATTYCLTLLTNYEGVQGTVQQFEFESTSGPPVVAGSKASGTFNDGGADVVYDDGGMSGR